MENALNKRYIEIFQIKVSNFTSVFISSFFKDFVPCISLTDNILVC